MKDLINKLPENAYFDFLKKYFDQIEELFNSIVKFFNTLFDKAEEEAPAEDGSGSM